MTCYGVALLMPDLSFSVLIVNAIFTYTIVTLFTPLFIIFHHNTPEFDIFAWENISCITLVLWIHTTLDERLYTMRSCDKCFVWAWRPRSFSIFCFINAFLPTCTNNIVSGDKPTFERIKSIFITSWPFLCNFGYVQYKVTFYFSISLHYSFTRPFREN